MAFSWNDYTIPSNTTVGPVTTQNGWTQAPTFATSPGIQQPTGSTAPTTGQQQYITSQMNPANALQPGSTQGGGTSGINPQLLALYQQYGMQPGAQGSGLTDWQYWQNVASTAGWPYVLGRLQSDLAGSGPDAGSAGGGGAGGATGPLGQLEQTPGYQFTLQQAMDAIQRSAAAQGTLLTGGTLKALQGYAGGLASQTYQNAVGNAYNLAALGQGAAAGV